MWRFKPTIWYRSQVNFPWRKQRVCLRLSSIATIITTITISLIAKVMMNKHWNPLSPPHAPGVADCLPTSSLCGKNPTRRFSSCPCRGQWGELVAESLTIINCTIKLLYLIIIMLEIMKRKILNSSSRLGQLQCSWWSGLVEEALWVLFLLSVHRNIISYQSRAPLIRWPLAAKPRSTLLSSLVLTRGWLSLSSSSILLLFHPQQQYGRAKICLLRC